MLLSSPSQTGCQCFSNLSKVYSTLTHKMEGDDPVQTIGCL